MKKTSTLPSFSVQPKDTLGIFDSRRDGKRRIIPNRLYFDDNYVPPDLPKNTQPVPCLKEKIRKNILYKIKKQSEGESEQKFKCFKCQKTFSHRRTVIQHLNFECCKEPRFKCPYCEYRSKWVTNVKGHVKRKHEFKKIYAINLMEGVKKGRKSSNKKSKTK